MIFYYILVGFCALCIIGAGVGTLLSAYNWLTGRGGVGSDYDHGNPGGPG